MSQDITYESVAKAINAATGLSFDEIAKRVAAIEGQFSGLLTRVGAVLIMGEKLGVKTDQPEKAEVETMYIKDVLEGTPKAAVPELVATVLEVYERKDFTKKDGSSGFVVAAKIGDATGNCRFSFFNDTLKKLGIDSPSVGQIYTFKDCVIEAPYGERATKNALGVHPPWDKVKSAIIKGGTVPDAPAGTKKAADEGNGLDKEIDKSKAFTFGKTKEATTPAGKDWYPLLVKVVKVLVKKEVDPAGTGVEFTPEEQKDLQPIIEGV